MFKIVIGGAAAVGKTTLLHRYLKGVFIPGSTMTIGVAFHAKEIIRSGDKVKLSLWDLGGQQRFRFMQSNYSAGARAAIVFFDASRPDTISQVDDWVSLFRAHAAPDIPIVLCGNKTDLVDPHTAEQVHQLGRETVARLGLSCYLPTSSKSGENVDAVFTHIIDILLSQIATAKELNGANASLSYQGAFL
jgi:small GTP-binding protein